MKQLNIILSFLILLSNTILSYQDLDIDGVDDNIDKCLETPFDELVDKDGCSKSQKPTINYGNLTVKIGEDIFIDTEYDNDSSLSLYTNYRYNSWDISISNSRSTTNSSYNNSSSDNDIYISLGKFFDLDKNIIKLSIGTKIAGDIDSNREYKNRKNLEKQGYKNSKNRDNDYFASFDYNHILDEKQNLFLYYGYTFSGDSQCIDYTNFSSFSMGTGYLVTPKWYSTVSYNHIGSIYKDGDASSSIEWYNNYNFTKNISASIGYSYAFDDISYENTLSLILGFSF